MLSSKIEVLQASKVALSRQLKKGGVETMKNDACNSSMTTADNSPPFQRLYSVIEVREDGGTEVTLTNSEFIPKPDRNGVVSQLTTIQVRDSTGKSSSSPCSVLRPMNALLDAEITPSPLKCNSSTERNGNSSLGDSIVWNTPDESSPQKVPFCGMMGAECYYDAGGTPLSSLEMHCKICNLLGSPVSVDSFLPSWQAWSYFNGKSGESRNVQKNEQTLNTDELKGNIKRVLQNRAFDLSARKARLSTLRRDLSPFNQNSTPNMEYAIRTRHRSLTGTPNEIHARASSGQGQGASPPKRAWVTPEKDLLLWQCGMQCGISGVSDEESPILPRSMRTRTDAALADDCYDSDPEDFVRRKAPNDLRLWSIGDKENANPNLLVRNGDQGCADDAKTIAQEMMNKRLTLILHQGLDKEEQKKVLWPRGMHVWIERGQSLKCAVIPPRLVWAPTNDNFHSGGRGESKLRRRIFSRREEIQSIALLDIHRILEVEKIDRSIYPFAKKRHTFLIKTLDRTLMFEAPTATDRDRIVKELKTVVARLGSLLLLKNESLVDEFFVGGQDIEYGPGNEPYWLNDTV